MIGIGFVVSEFNNEITEEMIEQAKKTVGTNAEVIDIINVPGAFDAPLAVKKLLMNKKIDCVAVLGTVVKGETKHDEVIVFNIANKLIELSLEFNKPVTLGIIGPGVTWKQATARAASYAKHATETAIKMTLRLKR
ncbi:6,7-dimethyl-8-ribityllumazine synthase [Candidatus Micrarchaeota archaeon]|nr:6,7-dimethyl-8-ribityllumazine synthase [Candidatus Micrarchaeota archaeon]